jgi:aminopeptidase N
MKLCEIALAGLLVSLPLACARAAETSYDMSARIEPQTGTVSATVAVDNPSAEEFTLYRGFTVRQVLADGKSVAFSVDPTGKISPYAPTAQAIRFAADRPRRVVVVYDGTMAASDFGGLLSVNGIECDRVELGLYAPWFPIFDKTGVFDLRLSVDLPKTYTAASNGALIGRTIRKDRAVYDFRSQQPVFDITLVASPNFKTYSSKDGTIDFYDRNVPVAVLEKNAQGLAEGRRWLTSLWGKPRLSGSVRIAYMQRSLGGGYSRLPLIVVNEQKDPNALAAGEVARHHYHYLAHEMAHFWWMIADDDTADGWIDEGLAEYSADRLTARRFGPPTAERSAEDSVRIDGSNKTDSAIAETLPTSPDRELNWYAKSARMFARAEQKFGEPALDRFLRTLYQSHRDHGHPATTAEFLALAGKVIGPDAEAFFRGELYRKYPVPAPAAGKVP